MSYVQIKNLSKTFHGQHVLQQLDLAIEKVSWLPCLALAGVAKVRCYASSVV